MNSADLPKLRVGHVSLGLDVGGQEKLLVEFAKHLDPRSFEQHFISLTTLGPIAAQIGGGAGRIHALNKAEGLQPATAYALSRLIQKLELDVVHTHDSAPLVYATPAAAFPRKRRFVHTQHHGKLPQMTNRQERLVGLASRFTDRFICVSADSAVQVQSQGAPRAKLSVILNGIDTSRFTYRGGNAEGPIVAVGRLSPEKDHANLLRAVAIAAKSDPAIRLEIAGDGPLRSELLALAAELNIADRVRLLGQVDAVADVYARASLFVLPSRAEGISLTLLEAMASGLPVVATAVGGNREVVKDGETGILVPAQNPQRLADAIVTAKGRSDFGVAGRARVQSLFDIKTMISSYEQLYRDELRHG